VSTDQRKPLLDRLSAIPSEIAEAARRAGDSAVPEGEWPARTVVLHLIATDSDVWQSRLRQMAREDNPHWPWVEPDLEGWARRFATYSIDDLLDFYASVRRSTLGHLNSLSDAGWARAGTHAVYGVLDVAGLCRQILRHDEEHLAELHKRAAE
jgi:hypothetical protein